ncbi:MAG: LysE family transporter, partial [Acetobacteraceae bacterium]|nr:LysE family transporter [Acetobacteraceae bacterium]
MTGEAVYMAGIWRPVMALIVASAVIMGSPGPSTISATAVGAAFGFWRSLRYVSGLIAGTIGVLLAVAVGVVAFVLAIPHGARVLEGVAIAYIVVLAFRIAMAPPLDSQARPAVAPGFAGGFLLAIANPKAYLAIAAVFAGSTILAENHGLDAVVKTACLGIMIVVIHLGWLSAGASLSRVLHDPVSSRLVNVSLAVLLV